MQFSKFSLGMLCLLDLAETGASVVVPIVGTIGMGTVSFIVISLVEFMEKKRIIEPIVLGICAAAIIVIPTPVASFLVTGTALFMDKDKK